ncbi:MAG: hypothetical protein CK429_06150 [Mycobacterium sp.]|nr:MAG: hypothetical protein CK429_06150 [Mycobacterium sp.]PJE24013.1 MAG: hypothetical protein CK431_08295 [Mycobacterium sp.]
MVGELISRFLPFALPGPVIGLVILFTGLCIYRCPIAELDTVADRLLANLALLFVPAGVGVVSYGALLAREWLPIVVALVGSTVATIIVTSTTMSVTLRRRRREPTGRE